MSHKNLTANILLVDDRQENIFALEKILRNLDANIISVNSGNEALSAILRHRLALILMDVQMDGMDGFETAALIREYEETKDTPIIFVTAINKDQKYVFQGYQSGAVDYLFKPLDPDILISKVKVFLQIHQQNLIQEELIRKLQATKNKITESEIRIHSVLNNIQDAVVTSDKNGCILSFNMAAERLFQYSFSEIVEKSLEKLLYGPSFQNYMHVIQNHLLNPKVKILTSDMRFIGMRKNGQSFSGEMGISHITIDGQQLYTSSFRDITQRELYETHLIQAKDEAQNANQAKSTFLANMSHELRTPLNAIIGFSQLMRQNKREPLTASQDENIEQISSAGKHLLGLINEILDLAKIEAEKTILSTEPILLQEMIEEVYGLIEGVARDANIQVECNNECPADTYFLADLTRAKQVLLNLLGNAIKYNKPDGKVILSCEIDTASKNRVLFSVTDTGLGISEKYLNHIFEPFHRGDAEGSTIEGTGIGLALTKKLVEAMNGSIRVTSVVGKGSVFEVFFPLSEKLKTKKNTTTTKLHFNSLNQIRERLTILYIEDNPTNMRLVEKFLQSFPLIALKTAVTAEIGLAAVDKEPIDLILLDINLPDMNGYQACKLLQQKPASSKIPVIGLSANAMKADKQKALDTGFSAYLTKPVDLDELSETILKVLSDAQVILPPGRDLQTKDRSID